LHRSDRNGTTTAVAGRARREARRPRGYNRGPARR
jgi:hypothetical protein